MVDVLAVHLVSERVTGARDSALPDASVRHEFVSWRDSAAPLARADVIFAHGLASLVVAQKFADSGVPIVFRPTTANRAVRRRLRQGVRASWVAAPDRRTGLAVAGPLGLERRFVTVVRDDDLQAWDLLALMLKRQPESADHDVLGAPLGPARRRSRAQGWLPRRSARSSRHRPSPDAEPGDGAEDEVGTGGERERPAPLWESEAAAPVPASDQPVAHGQPHAPPPDTARGAVPTNGATRAMGAVPTNGTNGAPRRAQRDGDLFSASTEAPLQPRMLPTNAVDPTAPGHPWWMYRRLDLPPAAVAATEPPQATSISTPTRSSESAPRSAGGDLSRDRPDGLRPDLEIVSTPSSSGVGFLMLGLLLLAVVAMGAQLGKIGEAPYLIPLGGLFVALAAARHVARTRPEEAWVGQWLVLGLIVKLLASAFRYYTLVHTYNGLGDASGYDMYGREFANAWRNGTPAPVLKDLHATNFLRWFTGVTYYVFGQNLLTGTLVFGLLALAGSYFWYRATVDAVPIVNKRLYFGFVMFAPSIAFWPAIVGKEALMQLGLGTVALGTSFLLRQRLLAGFTVAAGGGWLLWVVRPHLLALVAVGVGAAYIAGRVRREGKRVSFLSRPFGIVVIAFLVAFAIGQGAQFLGIKSLSLSSIQTELDNETAQTSQGGSQFHNSGNSLSPVNWPMDAVTVFLRPFPWEIDGSLQILASLESVALAALIVVRFRSLRTAFARSRESPFLMFCLVLAALYSVTFASFANFGLLVRERSLVLPALLVLLSVDPALVRRRRAEASESESAPQPGERAPARSDR